jgi:hypothetical protein
VARTLQSVAQQKEREVKRRLGAGLALSMACAACAGDDTPPLDGALANEIAAAYGGGTGSPTGSSAAGSSGSGGSGSVAAVGGAAGNSTMSSLAGAAGAAPSMSAAGGSQASPPAPALPPPAAPPCDGFAILQANCATGGCHGEGSNLEAFAASEAAARSYLGKSGTLACAGAGLLLDPKDPPASLMVQKLEDSPPCGNHMPLYGDPLPKADITCIEDWIGSLD